MFRLICTIFFAATLVHAQSQQAWVDSLYSQMTLDQKIGQDWLYHEATFLNQHAALA